MRDRLAPLVDRLAEAAHRRSAISALSDGWPAAAELEQVLAVLKSDYASAEKGPSEPDSISGHDGAADRLAALAPVFALDELDCLILTIAAAPELDANIGLAYALLRGSARAAAAAGAAVSGPSGIATRPSVALTLELTGLPTLTAAGFDRLGPNGALRDSGLIEIAGTEPWLARTLRVPDPVVAFLAGSDQSDPVVAAMRTPALPLELAEADVVARAVANGAPLVWMKSVAGTAGLSLAVGSFASLSIRALTVDARRCPTAVGLVHALAAAAREAGLHGLGLVVVGAELLGEPAQRGALELLERAAVPVIAVGARPWNPSWLRRFPLVVDAQPLTVTDREQVWQSSLGELTAAASIS